MTVALYFYRLGSTGGGAERMICQLAGALCERGFDVHLISWDDPDARPFYTLNPAVQWIKLGYKPGLRNKLSRTRALARVLKENDVRVLVGFVMSGDRTVYAAAKLAGVRLVAAERNSPAMYWLRYSRLERWVSFLFLRLADRIAVQIPNYTTGYPASLQGRIVAIPNPVLIASNTARPETANDAGRFTLLAVSRLDSTQKRLDCLIKAFARVAEKYQEWDLRIIGDGPEKDSLLRLVGEYDVTDRVDIEPSVADISDAYLHANLFVMPSLWEGFPNALAEAMSHGLPAVGFEEATGVSDLISAGGGWLARGLDDEAALAETLEQAMSDGRERVRRGELARKRMTEFEPETQFDRWAALLGSMITGAAR